MSPYERGRSTRDRLATALDTGLPLIGIPLVLGAVVWGGGRWPAVWVAVLGLLLVEAGVWRLGSRVVHERRYVPLRTEVDGFIGLARALNRAVVTAHDLDDAGARATVEETVAAMHASVDRMVAVAARTEAELTAGEVVAVPLASARG